MTMERTGSTTRTGDDPSTLVGAVLAEVLGLPEQEIDPTTPLVNLGLESYTAVRLRRRLRERTGVALPFTDFFGPATGATLSAALSAALTDRTAPAAGTDDAEPRAGTGPGGPPADRPDRTGTPGTGRVTSTLPIGQWVALRARARERRRSLVATLHAGLGLTLDRWCPAPAIAGVVTEAVTELVTADTGGNAAADTGVATGEAAPPGSVTARRLPAPDLADWSGFERYAERVELTAPDAAPAPAGPVVRQTVAVTADGVQVSWELPDAVLPPDRRAGALAAYLRLLDRLGDGAAWHDPGLGWDPTFAPPEPPARSPFPGAGPLLHDPPAHAADRWPQAAALLGTFGTVSHRQLAARAADVTAALRAQGVGPGDLVTVACAKGPAQLVAVLGVAGTGAGFVPVEPAWPAARITAVHAAAGIRHAVVDRDVAIGWSDTDPARLTVLAPDGRLAAPAGPAEPATLPDASQRPAPDALAYVIFTSGSTGTPKGVAIAHRAARTTIDDITDRFGIGATDRVLALSALTFDLSIYDIFGVLGAGGGLVLPDHYRQRDPGHWLDLMAAHRVTVWNTAPALLEMLVEEAEGDPAAATAALASLRLVLLSGDWIPVTLPDRLRALAPSAKLVSLGGATEGSIWSICYPVDTVDPAWTSIPYGRPLRGQSFHILDEAGRPCRVGEAGELHIGGQGLARGYVADPVQTADRFRRHEVLGERLYRTGDLGRWRLDGTIEFLGRVDRQVKIQGHRIELGEIESVLHQLPQVRQCVAAAVPGPAGRPRLVAYVTAREPAAPPSQEVMFAALRAQLPDYLVPARIVVVARFTLTANGKVDYAALPNPYQPAPRDRVVGDGGDRPVGRTDLERAHVH